MKVKRIRTTVPTKKKILPKQNLQTLPPELCGRQTGHNKPTTGIYLPFPVICNRLDISLKQLDFLINSFNIRVFFGRYLHLETIKSILKEERMQWQTQKKVNSDSQV